MSGGYINEEGMDEGEHQVVIFAFKGPIDATKCKEWNQEINGLKQMFGDQVIGVTMNGLPTPVAFSRQRGPGATAKAPKKPPVKTPKKRGRKAPRR